MKIYIKKVKNTKNEVKEWLWVDFIDNDGKRQKKTLKLLNTKANMKLAKNKIIPALLHKLENDKFIEKLVPTLNEFMVVSFKMNEGTRSLNTQNDYRISYDKHISLTLGHLRLDKIKVSHIKQWQSDLLKKVSPRRVRNVRATLSTILKDAMADELIEKNPLSLVKTVKVSKTEITPFNMDEIKLILENSSAQDRNFFALAFFSGMRSGEMIGLKWSDINFSKLEIKISRSRKMGVDGKTKTESSNRTIEILDPLIPYLKSQYQHTGELNSYVFLNKFNEPIYDIKRIREKGWKKTLKACNLEYRTIYQTRHSFATMMLENGEDILWLSNMLGHTDSSMTLSKYTHYVKKEEKKRGQFLNKEFSSSEVDMTLSDKLVA
jgi:integrase